jgi:glucan phosphoethanolaminetransferase (alkaline phosphatase superfamily)
VPSRWRRVAPALFAGQMVALDLALRGAAPYMHSAHIAAVWIDAVASVLLGLLVFTLRGRRPARIVLAAITGALVAIECLFFRYYHSTIDRQVVASALHTWADIAPVLWLMLPTTLLLAVPLACAEYAVLVAGGEPVRRPRALTAGAWLIASSVALALPLRLGTPELRVLDAVTLAWAPKSAAAAATAQVPPLPSRKEEAPSILFVLTESVRATSYCGDPAVACAVAPEVSALFPRRVAFTEMRSVGSYTAVAVSALITGQTQQGSREDIQRMPTVFDFVRQVRVNDRAPRVAYWSAQLSSLFERDDVRNAIDSFTTLETLVGSNVLDEDDVVDRGVDRLLADHAVKELPLLAARSPGPVFVMLHFAGTHAPYFVEPRDAPYQPWRREPSWSGLPALEHAYDNAIHEQDKSIARAIRAFVETRGGAPWIVLLTSDHGEAFGEHGAIHHGQSLYDEQVHVPAWIAFSPGALRTEEERNLRAASTRATTHLDLLPTLLDALGVLDTFALDPYRKRLRGRSLLRPLAAFEPIPITNCTAMFPCPVSTWGMLGEDRTLLAQPWDNDWRCVQHAPFDWARPARDELGRPARDELASPGDAACEELRAASRQRFTELPNHTRNP